MNVRALLLCLVSISSVAWCWAEGDINLLDNGNARIVFVGDSITGQSRNRKGGFANVIEAALRAVYPDSKPDLISLGGSGQPVAGWLRLEEASRTAEETLDVPGIGVKTNLDRPADILVVMLGMNDVLAPYLDGSDASLDQWIGNYDRLLEALRQRVHPKVLALGGVTLCTEDLSSPNNQLIDRMNAKVQVLAKQIGGIYLPTSEVEKQVLKQGRAMDPAFHLTYDFVHPNDAGHMAIAIAMLRGLGDPKAAQWIVDNRLDPSLNGISHANPGISWKLESFEEEKGGGRFTFHIHYDWTQPTSDSSPQVKLNAPDGWSVTPDQLEGSSGTFLLTGNPARLQSRFVLEGRAGTNQSHAEGTIPAPWLIATKLIQPLWTDTVFDAQGGRTPIDEAIERGNDFTLAPASGADAATKPAWRPYFSSSDYLGGSNPSNIDFLAVTHPATFEGGYGARWVYSDRDRPITLKINSAAFGNIHLMVWVNGQECYRGDIVKEPGRLKAVATTLHKGWNVLAFKSNHRTWLWQFCIELTGSDGDSLSDIRYSIHADIPSMSE